VHPNAKAIIQNAKAAASAVRAIPLRDRLVTLQNLQELLFESRAEVLERIQAETRKSRFDALSSELFPLLEFLEDARKRVRKNWGIRKVHTPITLMGKRSWIQYEPYGVILVISPWNYPLYQTLGPIALSYACGNATVLKPSEHTPLRGLVEDLTTRAGFQTGSVQVVQGDGGVGAALIDAGPDKIFFTGSETTGRKIAAQAGAKLIPVDLELGGKDAMIVFDDVTLERAVQGALWGAFTHCGQSCTSVEIAYVQKQIYPQFVQRLKEVAPRLRRGVDAEGESEIGEMTTEFQRQKVIEQVGASHAVKTQTQGALDPLWILEQPAERDAVLQEETFGPVLPVVAFQSEEEVIARVNASRFGLSASVWSKDLARARRVASALEVGNVSINNVMLTEANAALPFGGRKASGLGRYKGDLGLLAFAQPKSILQDRDSPKIEAHWYPYGKRKTELFDRLLLALFSGAGWTRLLRTALAGLRLESHAQQIARKNFSPSNTQERK
jgi:acyl-CoA reductase-like NAD-dependent aldehyde dehydrogenase